MFNRLFLTLCAILIAAAASAQTGYRVKSGDSLNVEVLEDASLNRTVLVLPDGSISVPLAGSVQAAGRTTGELAARIAAGIAPNFAAEPNVFVSVATLGLPTGVATAATIDVYLLGEVNQAGALEVSPGTTLLQALSQAGGFTPFAATNRIQLRRSDPRTGADKVYRLNYRAVEAGQAIPNRTILADGDVILVPQRRLFE